MFYDRTTAHHECILALFVVCFWVLIDCPLLGIFGLQPTI